jgi:hypothetical protein
MRYALVLLLAGPVLAQEDKPSAAGGAAAAEPAGETKLGPARAAMEAQLKQGDELRAKGDLDGAIAAYRAAVAAFQQVVEREEGKVAEGEKAANAAPEPAPADDGTPDGRKRVIGYYAKLLAHASDEVRYNAVAQLGEMRAVEARDAILAVLEKDRYQIARRAAAWALGRLGSDGVPAIPALIREVGGEFPLLGHMCDEALGRIAEAALGESVAMGFKAEMTPAERLEVQKKWQAWFDGNRTRLRIPDERVEEGAGGGADEKGEEKKAEGESDGEKSDGEKSDGENAEERAREKAVEPPPEPPSGGEPAEGGG